MKAESFLSTAADWVVAIGTLALAFVAALQDRIRAWLDSPRFEVTTETAPPCCVMVPVYGSGGFSSNYVFLRIRVKNTGTAAAKNVEAHAESLHRINQESGDQELVRAFPPMNLKWANSENSIYISSISPDMGRYCDVCHVPDPARRIEAEKPREATPDTETTMVFDLQFAPNHKGHVVGPGAYVLEIRVAAENCRPIGCSIEIVLEGKWSADEATMLRDFVRIKVLKTYALKKESWWVFFLGQWPR